MEGGRVKMVGDFLGVSETGGTDRFGDVYYNGKIHLLRPGVILLL